MLSLYLAMIDTDEDRAKFAALYERYSRLMFYIARQILGDEQLSEDAVQEALLRIARNMHKVGEVSCPQTRNFTVIITRNAALTMKKQACHGFEEELEFLDRTRGNIDELFEQVAEKQRPNVSSSCRIFTATRSIFTTYTAIPWVKQPACLALLLKA